MNYWMFTVMYDSFPTLWPALVERRLAAQHYPKGWTNETRNINALRQMKKGDAVIAALKAHRFAGYGFLGTDFSRGGVTLDIVRDDETFPFQGHFEIDWIALPLTAEMPYVVCDDLKSEGYDVDLRRGLCVKQTEEKIFTTLREILDNAGARRQGRQPKRAMHRSEHPS